MAILHGGPNGAFSGKVGSVIGVVRLGTAIIRGRPRPSKKNKKGTVSQNANRSLFTKMQHFLGPILDFIRVGFHLDARSSNRTAHNSAKSYNLLHAFDENGEIDCSKVLVSYGSLPGARDAKVERDDTGLHFSWTDNSREKWADAYDQVMLLAYDIKREVAYGTLSGARRIAGQESLLIHDIEKIESLHVWIAFISDNRDRISMSSYVGMI